VQKDEEELVEVMDTELSPLGFFEISNWAY
jgi:hypothetical protein